MLGVYISISNFRPVTASESPGINQLFRGLGAVPPASSPVGSRTSRDKIVVLLYFVDHTLDNKESSIVGIGIKPHSRFKF